MISLAVIVLGVFAFSRLAIDLHPHLIYPEVRVRILSPGVPATVMEDQFTRQLEEQLAITEDAIGVQSRTGEGAVSVDLSFEYGKDIDIALRDASTRLDRAKRFLPDTPDPPMIYKRDPAQIPVLEFVVSSPLRDPVELRSWVDDVFSKWFINLPGVAAAEVGGGLIREIQVLPDQQRLAGVGLTMQDVIDALQRGNREDPAGRLKMSSQELSGRISGRFTSVEQIAELPLRLQQGGLIHLQEVAEVIDTHEDERLRVRVNGEPGIKLSIQKQPTANTVAVADAVEQRLDWLAAEGLIPEDIRIRSVSDQSRLYPPGPVELGHGGYQRRAARHGGGVPLSRQPAPHPHHRQRHSHRDHGDVRDHGSRRVDAEHHDPGRPGAGRRADRGQYHRDAGEHLPPPAHWARGTSTPERTPRRRSTAPSSPPPAPTWRRCCRSCSSAV